MLLSHISRLGLGIKQTPATSGVPVFTGDIWGHLATTKEVFIAFYFTMGDTSLKVNMNGKVLGSNLTNCSGHSFIGSRPPKAPTRLF